MKVDIASTFDAWQAAARTLLRAHVPPAEVEWNETSPQAELPGLAGGEVVPATEPEASAVRVPRRFLELARTIAGHRDGARWSLLYAVLWRIVNERRDLLDDRADPQVARLLAMEREARRDAWRGDREAARAAEAAPGAAAFVPAGAATLGELRDAALRCTGCPLYRDASQTVFGRGPLDARIALVGEQPGDQEDLRGAPFVGPAGEVLDRALAEVGLERDRLYVTNVVKHFKFVRSGRRRIHQTPTLADVGACRPWLEAELTLIRPGIVVCLGATAARAMLGPEFRLMRDHGRFLRTRWAERTMATLHPSAVLRGEDEATQACLYAMLRDDLATVAAAR